MTEPVLPNTVLQKLLSTATTQARRDKLQSVHAICRDRHAAGEHDFSVATIGKVCTAAGILNGRGLTNKGAEAYVSLIRAWAAHSESEGLGDTAGLLGTNPTSVLLRLLAQSAHSVRKRNLRHVHETCRKHHATGSLDFSLKTIGALCDAQGVLNGSSLMGREFEDFRVLIRAWDDFARPWLNPELPENVKPKRAQKQHDVELQWVARNYPELEPWRVLAAEWLKTNPTGLNYKLAAMNCFFTDYLHRQDVPKATSAFLTRGTTLPDFRATACPNTTGGVTYNNAISLFIDWVLLKDFSELTDFGERVVSPAFRNPVPIASSSGTTSLDESVRSPLPYGYLEELRQLLAQGPHFKDWTFAQNALGAAMGDLGAPGRDWFDTVEHLIDRADPDCVWRVRERKGKSVVQMWSPVRWVALHLKLLLPLRTTQVRMLDSGESDSWTYSAGSWLPNEGPIAEPPKNQIWRQGVLRRNADQIDPSKVSTTLYINTNKTADIGKDGVSKGYIVPWFEAKDTAENVYYWLEKLRNWQTKYNPISKRTSWSELDGRHIAVKSDEQLAGYPDTCFLFRLAEGEPGECHLPVTDGILVASWCKVLEELERRLAVREERHSNGAPIRFVTRDESGRASTDFPLHSLRVSLITALALDGEVPFPILQKLVGHSRLLMTLYYTKPGMARINSVLADAAEKLDAAKERSINEFLLNTEHARLVETAVCNSPPSLSATIPQHPAARNAAGWMPMHHGLCLVGGNTSELEDNRKIGGCHNGGPNVGTEGKPLHGPVPGGSRNCIRCRWFVTEPHYLPALAAHFNTIAYHFDEARNKSMAAEQALQGLKRVKARMEAQPDGGPFVQHAELRTAERLWESSLKRFSDLAEDLVACWRLLERCQAALNKPQGAQQLLVQGAITGVQAIFEETESELLQLSGVCESLELFPDLESGKAIIRRSQLLDSALFNEGLPPVFMRLSEGEQLLAGNAFMNRLTHQVNPENPALAQRQVVALMDAGKRLSEHLGINLGESIFWLPEPAQKTLHPTIARTTDDSNA